MAAKIRELRRNLEEELPATQFVGGFPRKFVSVVASAPGVGKTWFLLKTCIDISTGGNVFFGLAYNQPPTKTLIMCGEGGIEMLVERTRALNQYYDPEKVAVYTAADLAAQKVEICLDEKAGAENLEKIIVGEEAQLTFIDTLIAFRSDDENASKETARLLNRLAGIARKTNSAIVITHHTRKKKRKDTGETTQDDIIGSSAITRLCATAWLLTKDDGDLRKLQCVKTWWKSPQPIAWTINPRGTDQVMLKRENTLTGIYAKLAAIDFLASLPVGSKIPIADIITETYAEPHAVLTLCEALRDKGKAEITTEECTKYITVLKNISQD